MGVTGRGSAESPVSQLSTAPAAARPSEIAQTMSDWPRPMSPATKTPGTVDMKSPSRTTLPRPSTSTPSASTSPSRCAPVKPMASSTRSAGISRSVPSTFWKRPSTISTSCTSSARTLPAVPSALSPRKRSVLTEYSRSPPSSCALETRRISG